MSFPDFVKQGCACSTPEKVHPYHTGPCSVDGCSCYTLHAILQAAGFSKEATEAVIEDAIQRGEIWETKPGTYRRTRA